MASGLVLAGALASLLSDQLFGVSPFEPSIYATVALILFLTALGAGYIPARCATRVDPIEALRAE
jgi:ABC-type antimicrobial peptide transport system permease subunit